MQKNFETLRKEFLGEIFSDLTSLEAARLRHPSKSDPELRFEMGAAQDMMGHRTLPDKTSTDFLILEALWLLVWDAVLPTFPQERGFPDDDDESGMEIDDDETGLLKGLSLSKKAILPTLLCTADDPFMGLSQEKAQQIASKGTAAGERLLQSASKRTASKRAALLQASPIIISSSPTLAQVAGAKPLNSDFGRQEAISPMPNTTSALVESPDEHGNPKVKKSGENDLQRGTNLASGVKVNYGLLSPMGGTSQPAFNHSSSDDEDYQLNSLSGPDEIGRPHAPSSTPLFPPHSKQKALQEQASKILRLLTDVAKHHRLKQHDQRRKNLLLTAMELLCKRTSESMGQTGLATKCFAPTPELLKLYETLLGEIGPDIELHAEVRSFWRDECMKILENRNLLPGGMEQLLKMVEDEDAFGSPIGANNVARLSSGSSKQAAVIGSPEQRNLYSFEPSSASEKAKSRSRLVESKERILYKKLCAEHGVSVIEDIPGHVKARISGDALVRSEAGASVVATATENLLTSAGSVVQEVGPQKSLITFVPTTSQIWKEGKRAAYEKALSSVYAKHNASNLTKLGSLLTKHAGAEEVLLKAVLNKYKLDGSFEKSEEINAKKSSKKKAAAEKEKTAASRTQEGKELKAGLERDLARVSVKATLFEVFSKHNASKLANLDEVMAKYEDKEQNLMKAVCDKYGVSVSEEMDAMCLKFWGSGVNNTSTSSGENPKGPSLPTTGSTPSKREERVKKMREHILAIYEREGVDKNVDEILKKYEKREALFYVALCKKYNEKPDPELVDDESGEKSEGTLTNSDEEQLLKDRYAFFLDKIEELYKRKAPEKVKEVGNLLSK